MRIREEDTTAGEVVIALAMLCLLPLIAVLWMLDQVTYALAFIVGVAYMVAEGCPPRHAVREMRNDLKSLQGRC